MSVFNRKFQLIMQSHGPISAPSGGARPERVGFSWERPPANFTLENGILQAHGQYMGIMPKIEPEQPLYYIPWKNDIKIQKIRFEERGDKYMMRVNSAPVIRIGDGFIADEEQSVGAGWNVALFDVISQEN